MALAVRSWFAIGWVVALSACGGPCPSVVAAEDTTFDPALNVDLGASTKLDGGQYIRDLVVGEGKALTRQELISTHYQGWLSDGGLFDEVGSDGGVFTFNYGAMQVLPGWDQGLDGMNRGGVRQLIIPPGLAYCGGAPPAVPPDTVVVFLVELLMETTGGPPSACGCSSEAGVSALAWVLLLFVLQKGSHRS